MNRQRRRQIIDQFPAINNPRSMDPALNTTVQAILDAGRIEANLTDDSLRDRLLFDPAWCPAMHDKLVAELEELHALEREGAHREFGFRAEYVTFRGETYDPHDPADTSGTALLKWPGDNRIFVCRNNADRLAAMMKNMGPWGVCGVCIAEDCQACTYNDHPTRPLPIACGRVVLIFEICQACEFVVTDTVFYNLRSSVMEAQAKLPPGAVIDPRSPLPPAP